jgi:hypothetical protein
MRRLLALLWLVAVTAAAPAIAGRSCEANRPGSDTVAQGLLLAERTLAALDASGADVVILARAGQDLGKYGLRYSHLGFAYRDGAEGGGAWRVLHKLNTCGSASAALFVQGLGQFFLDDLWRMEAAWVIPEAAVQQALLPQLRDPARRAAMHHAPYNLVSYPWSDKYQQSNQWAIETLAAAVSGALSRGEAQAWLQASGYQPTTLRLRTLTRLGGRISAANIAFDDHPGGQRIAGRIETVTVDSVFAWLQRAGLAGAPVVIAL